MPRRILLYFAFAAETVCSHSHLFHCQKTKISLEIKNFQVNVILLFDKFFLDFLLCLSKWFNCIGKVSPNLDFISCCCCLEQHSEKIRTRAGNLSWIMLNPYKHHSFWFTIILKRYYFENLFISYSLGSIRWDRDVNLEIYIYTHLSKKLLEISKF